MWAESLPKKRVMFERSGVSVFIVVAVRAVCLRGRVARHVDLTSRSDPRSPPPPRSVAASLCVSRLEELVPGKGPPAELRPRDLGFALAAECLLGVHFSSLLYLLPLEF